MSRSSGFTLIELLIVIAIIAILAAILFPVFATAREKARQTTCASNEKQLSLAFLQYATDFDETLPFAYGANAADRSWDIEIYPYLKLPVSSVVGSRAGLYTCPDDSYDRGLSATKDASGNYIPLVPRSYVMCGGITISNYGGTANATGMELAEQPIYDPLTPATRWSLSPGRLMSEVPAPAQTFMIVEWPYANNNSSGGGGGTSGTAGNTVDRPTSGSGASGTGIGQDCKSLGSPSTSCGATQQPLHNGGWNYAFADGHIKWLRPDQTIGTGLNGGGTSVNASGASYTCSMTQPCGYWTITDGD
jgi:prepilin-type N-terminal cleavage/methylation domain-containing protein/prepilin-type processing-associated H-X9-DG protein